MCILDITGTLKSKEFFCESIPTVKVNVVIVNSI